jgi:hypothetical protein
MIGTKKLSAIRDQIEEALASSSENPVERLERLVSSAKSKGEGAVVMEGLLNFLRSPVNGNGGKRRSGVRTQTKHGNLGR